MRTRRASAAFAAVLAFAIGPLSAVACGSFSAAPSEETPEASSDADLGDGPPGREGSVGDARAESGPQDGLRRRVFVTTTQKTSKFGGLQAADGICNAEAMENGLGGNFVAWLSGQSESAIKRLAHGGPWYLLDRSTRVFSSRNAIPDGPQVPIARTPAGTDVTSDTGVWTGTLATGESAPGGTCNGWTQNAVNPGVGGVRGRVVTGSRWTNDTYNACDDLAFLSFYCFEND